MSAYYCKTNGPGCTAPPGGAPLGQAEAETPPAMNCMACLQAILDAARAAELQALLDALGG